MPDLIAKWKFRRRHRRIYRRLRYLWMFEWIMGAEDARACRARNIGFIREWGDA